MATAELEAPPLLPGDNLSRAEFLRRWEMNPDIKKAELIEGIVYMPSPVSEVHGVMEGYIGAWAVNYHCDTPGTGCGHNTTSFLLDDTPQPDVFLRILPEYGGASWTDGKYLAGAPELLIQVCRSSAAYDLHQKFDLYQAAGVREYLAILLFEREVRWHFLANGSYRLLDPDADKVYRSRIFPGLWLDSTALFKGNIRQVLVQLQEGIDSAEHKAFVHSLAATNERRTTS